MTQAKSPLAELRTRAGYHSAKEFAKTMGVPATTYSRWERSAGSPEVCIPLRAAWAIADRLGCTIDDVVGRAADGTDARRDLNALYNSLSIGGQARLDEYVQYLDFRERVLAAEGR